MYLTQMSAIHHSYHLNPGEVTKHIPLYIGLVDFEQSYEASWKKTPNQTIHMLTTCLYPNTTISTRLLTDKLKPCTPHRLYVVNTGLLEYQNWDIQLRRLLYCQSSEYRWILCKLALSRQALSALGYQFPKYCLQGYIRCFAQIIKIVDILSTALQDPPMGW